MAENPLTAAFQGFGSAGPVLVNGLMGIGILLILGLFGWMAYRWWADRRVYNIPIRLIRYLDNGTKREDNGVIGGFITHNGIKDFSFKRGSKRIALGYLPDLRYQDGNNRLVFLDIGDGKAFQQVKEDLIKEMVYSHKDPETGKELYKEQQSLILTPISTDVKNATKNNLQSVAEMYDKKKITLFTIGIVAFIILSITHLISLFIQTRITCGVASP